MIVGLRLRLRISSLWFVYLFLGCVPLGLIRKIWFETDLHPGWAYGNSGSPLPRPAAATPRRIYCRGGVGAGAKELQFIGEIDMCSYSASLFAPARVQGADLVMIVTFQQKLNYRVVR
jgi:hypothetical protein